MNSEEAVAEWRPELTNYLNMMYEFKDEVDSREILRTLSAFSARASLMRNLIARSTSPKTNRFRIDELDPFLIEVDRQFKIYSRLISAEKLEYDLTS